MAILAILAAISLGSSIIRGFGQKRSGDAAKELAEFNAAVSEQQALEAIARGQENEQRFRASVRGLIGSQRTGFASQNIDIGVGSALDVVADTAFLGELDAVQIRTNAAREAWGYQTQAENFRMGGQNAQTAGRFAAASTFIGAGASFLERRLFAGE